MTAKMIAGKQNRENGQAFEIRVHNKIDHQDSLANCRSSGSFGLFDIWSMQKGKLRVVVCKANGYLAPWEKKKYADFMLIKPKYVQVEFWYYKSPKKMKKRIMKTSEDFLNWYFSSSRA